VRLALPSVKLNGNGGQVLRWAVFFLRDGVAGGLVCGGTMGKCINKRLPGFQLLFHITEMVRIFSNSGKN
jgi:hypothetical protein